MNICRSITGARSMVALAIFAIGSAAGANQPVSLDSAVYVEHVKPGDVRRLEPASRLGRGDRVVTVLTWRRGNGIGGFTVTNPLPRAIAYQASASDDTEVSADGGRTWGRLGMLRYGTRLATPEDVTHVRWRIPADSAARGTGQIAYSGIVR
ncbi:MAG: hypothetical protein AB7F98_08115 [Novosphingobium sp.]